MSEESRSCQNCKQNFTIESEDFDFYKKIDVPPPTWCPECRMVRRFLYRNHRVLYKRRDDLTGNLIFSMYSQEVPIKVWDRNSWWSDKLEALEYGGKYDWSRSFFVQLKELMSRVPWPSRNVKDIVRSNYSNNAANLKECYLVFSAAQVENSAYSSDLVESSHCFDSEHVGKCEISYFSFQNTKCFKSFFSQQCEESQYIWFCRDCVGVSNCFGCVGLHNKSYCIFNQPYSKEEYSAKLERFNLGSYKNLIDVVEEVTDYHQNFPVKYMNGRHNVDVSGDLINNSKSVKNSFWIYEGENLRHCQNIDVAGGKDSYDYFLFGGNSELIYDSLICGYNSSRIRFSSTCWPNSTDITYSILCPSSSHLFACVGLRNKQYCILNKQYTKEEYEELVPRIIKHMNEMPYVDSKGRVYKYGEFFPPELSPFSYNETIAQEYFPLTKEEALKQGYRWKDPEERNYTIDIKSESLPDHIKEVNDSIIGKVIECKNSSDARQKGRGRSPDQDASGCTEAFKIIEPELQFYRTMNLPLPRLCPNCRHYQRLKQRNPLKLWHRQCQCQGKTSENKKYTNTIQHQHGDNPCPNEFQTSYAPERPEIVYCEQCYNAEVV